IKPAHDAALCGLDRHLNLRYRCAMKMLLNRAPFSYLDDTSVPEFSARTVFTVMDARCSLCARGAAWIARNDKAHEFTIVPLQSDLGHALMLHYGLDPADPTSWLYVQDGRAYSSLDAFIRVGRRLGGVWMGLGVLRILPPPLQNAFYRLVARNRYRVFGTADLCSLPDPEVQERLLR
ncbi:MAG: DCC1-like thiol-disulfide oxidoreductase family protein, partial [Albidovulum sp.]